ncbi:MAG: cytochrome c3 family protein [Saprospiraceae bacterium]
MCNLSYNRAGLDLLLFANHDDYYQLNGAHAAFANDCATCHNGNYNNTPNTCVGCHQDDFNGTTNPDHQAAGLAVIVRSAIRKMRGRRLRFDHDNIYPLNGVHGLIVNDCAQCHANNNFANTPTECIGCHQVDFDNTSNPNRYHTSAQFSTDCTICHSENSGVPTLITMRYFPIYSGAHEGEWDQCLDCHTNPNNYMEVTCIVCHANPETDNAHTSVNGYVYENTACLACHPTGDADNIFDHNTTNFPLTGEHVVTDCIDCHSAGYAGTPWRCSACHQMDYDGTTNPNHVALGLPTDCASCHTTDPDWMPAVFPDHDNYYQLNGAHLSIANDCAACHNGNYNNTPNTCVGCHQDDYNNTTNPNHAAAQIFY